MIFELNGITRKFFFDIAFVEKAVSHDDTRHFINGILVETKDDIVYIVGTNGRFLNFVEYKKDDAPPLEDGFYRVMIKSNIIILEKDTENNVQFPNWHKVLPEQHIKVIDDFYVGACNNEAGFMSFYKLIYILNNFGCCLRFDYVQPVTVLNVTWDIYLNPYRIGDSVMLKNNSPHILSKGKYTSVIMPLLDKQINVAIHNALEKLKETLKEVNKTDNVLFDCSIHKKMEPLFEI